MTYFVVFAFVVLFRRKLVTNAVEKNYIDGDRLVYGVGVNDGEYKTYDILNKKHVREYHLWKGVLKRCYTETKFYDGCSMSENFKRYSYFYEWCNEQVGFNNEGWHLDKDILINGNKLYSEDTCVFVPSEINKFFTFRKRNRGEYPIGVSYHKASSKYSSTCSAKSKSTHLGTFTTVESAFEEYRKVKKEQALDLVDKWEGFVDNRVCEKLRNFDIGYED